MTKKLVIKCVGLIKQLNTKAELAPTQHPPKSTGTSGEAVGHYPRAFDDHIMCTGVNHLTFTITTHWRVASGVFDPFSLYLAVLKRLNSTDSEATQSGLSLNTGTYQLSLSGAGRIFFDNGGEYEWDSGSMTQNDRLSDQTTNIKFKNKAPDTIRIKLENDDDQIHSISLKDSSGNEQLLNPDFTQVETHFYDIEAWYVAATDPELVPPDVLGLLEGFNSAALYTVFE